MKTRVGLAVVALLLLAGCASAERDPLLPSANNDFVVTTVGVAEPSAAPSIEASPSAAAPSAPTPDVIFANDRAEVDATGAADGIVRVRVLEPTEKRVKVQVRRGDRTTYTYDLNGAGAPETLPLSDGDGVYTVTVYEQVEGTSYAGIFTAEVDAAFVDEAAPFRAKNKYVDWSDGGAVETLADELFAGLTSDEARADAAFEYVSENVVYDRETAENMPDGYVPSPDATAAELEGTCLDYASLMAAMLRSDGVAARLCVGYAGEVYHAWVEVLRGGDWVRCDPTFAASGSATDGIEYVARYYY